MDSTQLDREELRILVRRALLGMLQGDQADGGFLPVGEASTDRTGLSHEITLTLKGNVRSIGLLEEALRKGETTLEIGVGATWGPKVRVRADSPAFASPFQQDTRD
jgi:hypothetical protein